MNDDAYGTEHWPTEIRYHASEKQLEISFDNGETFRISAELLRVESPSAEVQGHSPSEKQLVAGRRHVGIIGIEPVGNYAVKLSFDDLHDTGIYTWSYLYALGKNQDRAWAAYLEALEKAGKSRDPGPNDGPHRSGHACGSGGCH